MKGRHHIVVETRRLKYEFDIKRNITIIQGKAHRVRQHWSVC